jgi:hypothetical protein
MPDVPYAYGYQNLVRDVSPILYQVIAQQPTFISIVPVATQRARQHKHEYAELELTPEQTTTTAAVNSTSTQVIPVASKAPFTLNAILRIEPIAGEHNEQLRVIEISDSANEITVQRAYGGTTAANIPNGSKLIVVSKPLKESTRASHKGDPTQPPLNHNFTEIFDAEAVVSRSMGPVHGIGDPNSTDPVGDALDFQVALQLVKISRRMNNALIYGRRVERTANTPGTMGGLLQAHEGGNEVNASNAVISEKILGDAFQLCLEGGATSIDTLLCGPIQARMITSLYKDRLMIAREDTTLGQVIYRVQPGMPIAGFVSTVVVDTNFPKTKVSLHSREQVALVPFRNMSDEDSRSPGDDFVARRMIGEYTSQFRNFKTAACLIRNLSPAIPTP